MISAPQKNIESIWAAVVALCREQETIQVRSNTVRIEKQGGVVTLEVVKPNPAAATIDVVLCDPDTGEQFTYRLNGVDITPAP